MPAYVQGQQHQTEYAQPVVQPGSPASSVGTVYGADEGNESDTGLDDHEFESKWHEKLGLGQPTQEEARSYDDPLIPPPKSLAEEKAVHEKILRSLRGVVRQVKENELFEKQMQHTHRALTEFQPASDDISILMQSMMTASSHPANEQMTPGPWNHSTPQVVDVSQDISHGSGTAGRKGTRAKNSRKP